MIRYLSTRRHDYAMRDFLAGDGAALADRIEPVAYEQALAAAPRSLPAGTWVFTDYDRLSPDNSERAADRWRDLHARGSRLLNHPTRSLRRHALLRALHERAINDFDAYPIDDGRAPGRYPVFIRRADAHSGPASLLLPDRAALDRAVAGMRRLGWPLHSFVIVEFADTRGPDGLYRKYGATRIGETIVAQHMLTTPLWIAKRGSESEWTDAFVADELRYVSENPHRDRLAAVFAIAGVDYGRIDYGMSGDRIQVWEINSNPTFVRGGTSGERRQAANAVAGANLLQAFAALAEAS